ncbi:MAG: ribosomal-processing cysteine protease Prp [Carnobacterium inhibens]
MIQATFHMNEKEDILAFKVEGHAGYAPSGRDIVCAAVSSLVIEIK